MLQFGEILLQILTIRYTFENFITDWVLNPISNKSRFRIAEVMSG